MKKYVILILIMTPFIIYGAVFYFNNLRGIWPAIQEPKADIAELITHNTTGLPLKLPPNFGVSIFASELNNPRVMQWDSVGNLLVSVPKEGRVVALGDKNGDGAADRKIDVITGLNNPHGIAFKCNDAKCKIYIAETHQVVVYDYDETNLKAVDGKKIIDLPDDGGHFTRTIMFMPYPNENTLLISVGSSCNVCTEKDKRRARILAYNIISGELKDFSTGLRNSVFINIHPVSGEIYATEMGRDLLGDNIPPDEINIIKDGGNYGWPNCYGKNIHDGEFDKNTYVRNPCMEPFEIPSYIDIQAHSAPLGLAFIGEEGWPEEYWHNLLVSFHGSWNRSEPTGYKVVRYDLPKCEKNNLPPENCMEDFISGWLNTSEGGGALGRPVDIITQPGGKIFISDDKAGVIYLVRYKPQNPVNLITANEPKENAAIDSPVRISGMARGYWFFEASFPIRIYNENHDELGVGIAQAASDWMTEDFVPFNIDLEFKEPSTKNGYIVLERDNPSGLREYEQRYYIPIRFR